MIDIGVPNTLIRIQKKVTEKDTEAWTKDNPWIDIIDEDIACHWQNKYGTEQLLDSAVRAKEPARIKLWFIPGINKTCRVKRVEDGAIFEIIRADDVLNRHQKLVLDVERYTRG